MARAQTDGRDGRPDKPSKLLRGPEKRASFSRELGHQALQAAAELNVGIATAMPQTSRCAAQHARNK